MLSRITFKLFPVGAAFLLLLLSSSSLLAHTGGSGGGFASGFSHPIGGLDHVLAMIAVGIWGAQLGVPSIWFLPIAFPLMMACGAALGLMGYPLPAVEFGIAVSAVILGLMVLIEARPPMALAILIVAFFAIFHGHAHGTELPEGQSGLLYSIGFVLSTGLLHAVGIGIGIIHYLSVGFLILRAAGAVVLMGGLYFLSKCAGLIS
jgi:urease accessory protein